MPYSFLLCFLLLACKEKPSAVHQFPASHITWQDNEFHILKLGQGKRVQLGDRIKVHFKAWYLDETEFDSSFKRNRSYSFVFGKGRVIPGWDKHLGKLQKGGQIYLKLPPELAFGDGKKDNLRAHATVLFGIEILK